MTAFQAVYGSSILPTRTHNKKPVLAGFLLCVRVSKAELCAGNRKTEWGTHRARWVASPGREIFRMTMRKIFLTDSPHPHKVKRAERLFLRAGGSKSVCTLLRENRTGRRHVLRARKTGETGPAEICERRRTYYLG